jgi:hypothetical protein
VVRTRNRVKRYAELRGNSENSGIKSLLDNINCYLELGTSKMDPKPFFGPVLDEVRLQGVVGFIRHNTRVDPTELPDVNQVLKVLAFAIERRVKEIITDKGLIDTGTLRASVVAIPGGDPSKLPDASEFSGFDSETPAPPTAGRALTETIELP